MMAVDKSVVTPFVAAIGKVEILEFLEFYVVVDGHLLKVDTMLQAVNVCFKSYFALQYKFPSEAYSIYSFFDCIIFKINQNSMTPTGQLLTTYLEACPDI